jgi:hypothetical protein
LNSPKKLKEEIAGTIQTLRTGQLGNGFSYKTGAWESLKRETLLEILQLLVLAILFAEPTEAVYIAQVLIPTLCILSAKCPLSGSIFAVRFFFTKNRIRDSQSGRCIKMLWATQISFSSLNAPCFERESFPRFSTKTSVASLCV